MSRPSLKIVRDETAEELLTRHFAERDTLAKRLQQLDAAIAACGRLIARERGLAFIRVEQLRQEFADPPGYRKVVG